LHEVYADVTASVLLCVANASKLRCEPGAGALPIGMLITGVIALGGLRLESEAQVQNTRAAGANVCH
jgi:hypothetical protein